MDNRVRTWAGEARGMTFTSVTVVRPVFASCLISCFFLSNSPLPRRSLIVSLYYESSQSMMEMIARTQPYNLQELAFHLIFPSFALQVSRDSEDLLDSTRDHSGGLLTLHNKTLVNGRGQVSQWDRRTWPPSIVKDLPEPVWPYAKTQTL